MRKVERAEILPLPEYEQVRPQVIRSVIAAKAARRVLVGDKVSLVFENHETIRYQIQEMTRIERIVDDAKVQDEIDIYNQLLPDDDELSATLFIEIDNEALLKATLPKLVGIEHSVRLKIGDRLTVPGVGEGGRSRDDYTSSVHYLRFPFSAEAKEALARGEQPVWLEIDHPNYGASARLSRETVEALARDLRTED